MTKIDNFLDRRLARRFQAHDHDGNGYLQREDFELSAIRMSEEFGHGLESPARKKLLAISLGLWDHLRKVADFNSDGRISLDEYKKAFAAGLLETPESFDQGYVPYINAVIDIADQDHDGKLTESEEIRWMSSLMGVPVEVSRAAFHRIDKDHDGFITASELTEAIRGYYHDNTPDSPGHWLLGSLG